MALTQSPANRPPVVPSGFRLIAYADGIGHLVPSKARTRVHRLCDGHSMSEQFAYPVRVRCPVCHKAAEGASMGL